MPLGALAAGIGVEGVGLVTTIVAMAYALVTLTLCGPWREMNQLPARSGSE